MNFTRTSPLDVLAMEMKLRSPFLKAIESILFGVIMLIAVFGNLLTLIAVYRNKSLRTIPNLFVISLAISDLGIGLTCMTLSCSALITSIWLYGNIICQFEGYLVITFAAASILTLAAMGFNRYIGIVKCLLYRSYFTTKRTIYLISVIWIVSAFPPFLYLVSGERFIFHPGKLFCFSDTNASWFTAFLVVVYVGLPSFLILFTYSKVFQTIHARNKRFQTSCSSRNKHKKDEVGDTVSVEEIRVTRTLFVIVLFYMVCWTPVLIIDLVDAFFDRFVSPRRLYLAYTFLASISSTSNPVIYGVMNRSFRKEYISILKSLPCLKNKRFTDQEDLGNSYNRATVVLSEGDIAQKSPFVILHGKAKYEERAARGNNDSLDNVDNGKDKNERILMTKL